MMSLHSLDHSIPGLLVARQLLAPLRRLDVLQLPIHLSLDFKLILLRQISKRDFDHVLLINVRVISTPFFLAASPPWLFSSMSNKGTNQPQQSQRERLP
jgi:hypothetical protein